VVVVAVTRTNDQDSVLTAAQEGRPEPTAPPISRKRDLVRKHVQAPLTRLRYAADIAGRWATRAYGRRFAE